MTTEFREMVVVSISHVDPPNEPSATSLFAIISSIDRLPSSRSTEKLLERVSGSQHDVWPHSLQQGLQLHKSRHGPGPHQYFRHCRSWQQSSAVGARIRATVFLCNSSCDDCVAGHSATDVRNAAQ